MPLDILTPCGPNHGCNLRSVSVANRILTGKTLPGEAAPGEISRCDNRENTGVSDEQFRSAGTDHCRPESLPLAGRTVLQMDQAEPENQDLLRYFRKCRQNPDLDCRLGVRACRNYEETAENRGQPLHNSTVLERYNF
jgi:hypothetical protein